MAIPGLSLLDRFCTIVTVPVSLALAGMITLPLPSFRSSANHNSTGSPALDLSEDRFDLTQQLNNNPLGIVAGFSAGGAAVWNNIMSAAARK